MKKDPELIASASESAIYDIEYLKGVNIVFSFKARVKKIRNNAKAIKL